MGSVYTPSVSQGRLAFRLVGWIFGVLTIGYSLFLVVFSIVSRIEVVREDSTG
jgi:hypothetical protein